MIHVIIILIVFDCFADFSQFIFFSPYTRAPQRSARQRTCACGTVPVPRQCWYWPVFVGSYWNLRGAVPVQYMYM